MHEHERRNDSNRDSAATLARQQQHTPKSNRTAASPDISQTHVVSCRPVYMARRAARILTTTRQLTNFEPWTMAKQNSNVLVTGWLARWARLGKPTNLLFYGGSYLHSWTMLADSPVLGDDGDSLNRPSRRRVKPNVPVEVCGRAQRCEVEGFIEAVTNTSRMCHGIHGKGGEHIDRTVLCCTHRHTCLKEPASQYNQLVIRGFEKQS